MDAMLLCCYVVAVMYRILIKFVSEKIGLLWVTIASSATTMSNLSSLSACTHSREIKGMTGPFSGASN